MGASTALAPAPRGHSRPRPRTPSLSGSPCSPGLALGPRVAGREAQAALTSSVPARSFGAPRCGRGKPALARRHTLEDRSQLISCIESGDYAKAARIAAGGSRPGPSRAPLWPGLQGARTVTQAPLHAPTSSPTGRHSAGARGRVTVLSCTCCFHVEHSAPNGFWASHTGCWFRLVCGLQSCVGCAGWWPPPSSTQRRLGVGRGETALAMHGQRRGWGRFRAAWSVIQMASSSGFEQHP